MTKPDFTGLLDRALAAGVAVKGGGGWLSFGDHKLGQGVEKAVAFLADNPEVVAAIEAALGNEAGGGNQGGGDQALPGAGAAVSSKKKQAKGELRKFPVLSLLKHDGDTYEVGSNVEIERALFLQLKGLGVVDGEWPAED